MLKQTTPFAKYLPQQKEALQNAVIRLKEEFIGIDNVIDQIADTIVAWIYFPELQERPVIVNLWGLTGTGKTSLIKRLSELIGFSDRYFHFDMEDRPDQDYNIRDTFKEIYDNCDGKPVIIGLDEFQFARTINEEGIEVSKPALRAVWDLLDCGKFDIVDFNYHLARFGKLIKSLDLALNRGVEVKNGQVVVNEELFKEIVDQNEDEEYYPHRHSSSKKEKQAGKKMPLFVSDDNLTVIYSCVHYIFLSNKELRNKLDTLDGEETLEYLIGLYNKALKPKTVDCTKALIFVMGNLDEVYSMTQNFNPDISADEFHRQSTKITITQVKDALLSRFRSEQIARLGNNHVIYPAFNEQSFYTIIRLELEKIRKKIAGMYPLHIDFDKKIEQLIYEEGVFPTQGTRPLFTTVYQIVQTRLGKVLYEVYLNTYEVDTLWFTTNEELSEKDHIALQVNFIKEGKIVHQLIDQQPLTLGKLRKAKQNDEQAICAVHESGHAVLSVVLMKTVPDSVVSVTASSESDGFVFARPKWEYMSKKEIVKRIAVSLGGWIAEKIVFGDENVTTGSASDLSNATQLATHALYACGMGDTLAAFGNQHRDGTPSVIFDNGSRGVNTEAKHLMAQAEDLALQTLEKQKVLLLQMADYLSNKRSAAKEDVKRFVEQYAVDFDMKEIVEDAECLFYRGRLKEMMEETGKNNYLCGLKNV